MAEFEIVPFAEEWAGPHADFARRNYPGKRRRADADYLRWKFRGPSSGPVPGLLVAVRHGEVIGQMGLLPGELCVRGEVQPTQWVCEMMVDPEQRRLGVTRALVDEAFSRGITTLGPDPSAVARKALGALGMGFVDASWVMVLPLRAGPVVGIRYPPAARADRLVTLAGAPFLRVQHRHLARAASGSLAKVCRWSDVVDLVVAHEATLTAPHAVHGPAFHAWRSRGLEGWTRELDAVLTEAGSYAILERDSERLTVHQWRADDDDEAAALFGRVWFLAGAFGLSYVQAYAADVGEKARLERLAFRARRTRTDVSVFPATALDDAGGDLRFSGYDSDYQL